MSRSVKAEADFSSEDIARFLLEQTCTLEPPTDAERIASYLGLNIRGFFHNEFNLDPDIRAYLYPARKEIGISNLLSPHRRKFSILHEVGHFVLPGHLDNLSQEETMLLDDSRSLSDHSVVTLEIEANQFAADCIFQLNRFADEVSGQNLEWSNVSDVANIYDASLVSTARRWVETSRRPCALLVFVPISDGKDISLGYSYAITSTVFRRRYFTRLAKFTLGETSQVYRVYRDISGYTDLVESLQVDIGEVRHTFDLMLYSTQFGVYALISP